MTKNIFSFVIRIILSAIIGFFIAFVAILFIEEPRDGGDSALGLAEILILGMGLLGGAIVGFFISIYITIKTK